MLSDTLFLEAAIKHAKLAKAAYSKEYLADKLGQNVVRFTDGATQGFITYDTNDYVLTFRGSNSVADWLLNMDATQRRGYGGRVHIGFDMAIDQVWNRVWSVFNSTYNNQRFTITGHSQGGALAILAGEKFFQRGYNPKIYTFAAPRVFNPFAAAVYPCTVYRFVNKGDLIPRLPMSRFLRERYADLSPEIWLPATHSFAWQGRLESWIQRLWMQLKRPHQIMAQLLNEHAMNTYIERLVAAHAATVASQTI